MDDLLTDTDPKWSESCRMRVIWTVPSHDTKEMADDVHE